MSLPNKSVFKIGHKIRAYRKANNISQEKLAEMINCSFKTVSNMENDNVLPNIIQIINLCDVLEISMDELFGEFLHKTVEPIEVDEIKEDSYPKFIHRTPIKQKMDDKQLEKMELTSLKLKELNKNELEVVLGLIKLLILNRK